MVPLEVVLHAERMLCRIGMGVLRKGCRCSILPRGPPDEF